MRALHDPCFLICLFHGRLWVGILYGNTVSRRLLLMQSELPTCSCGSPAFERVVLTRVGSEPYVTEFVACIHCRVMYHRPEVMKRSASQAPDDWAERYRKSVRKEV